MKSDLEEIGKELEEAATKFHYDVLREAETSGEQQSEAFFELYADAARENGELEHVDYCPVLFEGSQKYGIDGYYLNIDSGELVLVISDYHATDGLASLNKGDITKLFKRVDRFFDKSSSPEFINSLEETSPAFQAAYYIHTNLHKIKRVRVVLFSNAILAIRSNLVTVEKRGDIHFSRSILDFNRFYAIQGSQNANDPIEIDFTEQNLELLPCLSASASEDNYESYLAVMPGTVLAHIYRTYGARLLEANVRTFLQARTKVNKGIINTIEKELENFFAYNNGLTATAAEVSLRETKSGTFIEKITDLQVVNGGQTTASILYAADVKKADLSNVFVQMKLSRALPDVREELIPNISRYANSQNKVSEADLFSSHKFHLHMEQLSRRVTTPPAEGSLVGTKWFYERARGQYRDAQAYMTKSKRDLFVAEYPRSKMLVKTDLAKYEMTFMEKPHLVSQGAGKCFSNYADIIDKKWTENAASFGEAFFKDSMSRAMIFRWTDKHINTSEWYKEDRGYKSQIVTYTLAALQNSIKTVKAEVNFTKLWNKQELPASLQKLISELAPKVGDIIKSPPPEVRNVAEYCKRQYCWKRVSDEITIDVEKEISDCLISKEKAREVKKEGRATQRIDNSIEAQTKVVELTDEWAAVQEFGQRNRLFKPSDHRLVDSAKRMKTSGRIPVEWECVTLVQIYNKVVDEGYKPRNKS